ncbi:HPP family protein [Pseudonocardia sp. GCM10023141]|uniref:CBS domain-containing protein n=1 Tax=Pseudonocardia sp. GCM10023141 TaxID=3252653 RepID=UPI0036213BAD
MRARDVMSSPVLVAKVSWRVEDAAAALARHGFTAMPVVDDDDRLVGIVSEADVVLDPMTSRPGPTSSTVAGVMSTDVLSVTAHTDLAVVTHRMLTAGVRVVPVLDHGRVAGILTRRDLLRKQHRLG